MLAPTRQASGSLGVIEGFADDEVVFGRYAREGDYAPQLIELLARLCTGSTGAGTLLDVGAHIGMVSIGVARTTRARCLAFEPAPPNAVLLARNVQRQGLEARIELHPFALDESPGTRALVLSRDNSGDHRLRARRQGDAVPMCDVVEVPAQTLDAVLEGRELRPPVVLKLDTQGSEARVLRGATRSAARIDHAVIEYWPYGQHRMGEAPDALDALLCALFPRAAVIEPGRPALELLPTAETLGRLAWIARDGSDPGFFDLLLSKQGPPATGRDHETCAQR